jgi:hypothetical protein
MAGTAATEVGVTLVLSVSVAAAAIAGTAATGVGVTLVLRVSAVAAASAAVAAGLAGDGSPTAGYHTSIR